jgi:hypothetical protein
MSTLSFVCAVKTFEKWKATIDAQLKEKHKDSLKKTKKVEDVKKEDERNKKLEAESAYKRW